jgi:PilZ domain
MSGKERRVSLRKDCIVPVRFRVLPTGRFAAAQDAVDRLDAMDSANPSALASITGETVNLSERGLYFRSLHNFSVGQPLEIYLTLPRELTGRSPEEVRCSATIVHVEKQADREGFTGVGASVERFEPIKTLQNWAN